MIVDIVYEHKKRRLLKIYSDSKQLVIVEMFKIIYRISFRISKIKMSLATNVNNQLMNYLYAPACIIIITNIEC